MIEGLETANKALKYVLLYKDNWWLYSIIDQQNQMQEQLNETLNKLYDCSDELYRVKHENEMLRARLYEFEKAVSQDDEHIQFQCDC